MRIVRLAVWLLSAGCLSYIASAVRDGNAVGTWISVCCFATGVVIDGLLTADDARPAGDDTSLSLQFRPGEKGFHGPSMAELARGAGVNVAHIHHYFESKETKNDRANKPPPCSCEREGAVGSDRRRRRRRDERCDRRLRGQRGRRKRNKPQRLARGNSYPDAAGVGTPDVLRRSTNHRHPMSEEGDLALSTLIAFGS